MSTMSSFIDSMLSAMTQFNIPATVISLLYSFAEFGSEKYWSQALSKETYEPAEPRETHPEERHDDGGVVSIIHQGQNGPPTVVNHTLDDGAERSLILPGAVGYSFLSSARSHDMSDQRLEKLAKRSATSLEKLVHLLRNQVQAAPLHPTRSSQPNSQQQSPKVTIGDSAFLSKPPSPESSDMAEVYTKIQFQYANGITTTQYFNPHCSTIKPAHLKEPLAKSRHIDINTGICLFSKSVLSTSPGHGSFGADGEDPVIPTLPWNVGITMYELEIITRLSCAIADAVGLVGRMNTAFEAPVNVNIDIPDFQYYWTACELLQRRLVTVGYAQSWIAAIDERRRQLESVMTSLIRTMLRQRHLSGVKINITSGTEAASSLVKERVALGTSPSMEEIINALRSQGKDAAQWEEFFDHLEPRYQPLSVGDLCRLMYVFKTVKPALVINESTQDGLGRGLIIQVDDVNEWRILDRAKTFLKKYSKQRYESAEEPIIVGLFAMQRILVAGTGRSDLYLKDPGSRLCLASEKTVIGPLDLIGATYGLNIKDQLQLSCLQAGFK